MDERSATLSGCNVNTIPFDTDHSGLNKSTSSSDSNYQTLVEDINSIKDTVQEQDDVQKCLDSLTPVDLAALLEKIPRPEGDMCNWIRQFIDNFHSSLHESDSAQALIITAGPGSGKSVLFRFILEYLGNHDAQVRYFIFKEEDPPDSHATSALQTLVFQMLDKDRKLYPYIRDSYKERAKGKKRWTFKLLWGIFQKMVSDERSNSIIFLVDALNECDLSSQRDLLRNFSTLDSHITGRFILTTHSIADVVHSFPQHSHIDLAGVDEVKSAVQTVIKREVDMFFSRRNYSPKTQEEVFDYLNQNADIMFSWVLLIMDRLKELKRSTHKNLLTELKKLPKNLLKTYEILF